MEPDAMSMDSRSLTFDGQGLIPAVIQDWLDGTVLMVGYMNQDAIMKTLQTRSVHFWSRGTRWVRRAYCSVGGGTAMDMSDRRAPDGTGKDGPDDSIACGVVIVSNGISAIVCIW